MRSRWSRYLLALIILAIASVATLALLARPGEEHPWFQGLEGHTVVIAHQGGDGLWPGNTLFAMEGAAELGVDVLEMDVHMTRDGAIVLSHDETVDRLTEGSGLIREMTLSEVQALDAGHDWSPDGGASFPYRGQGIRIPTLSEILERFPDRKLNIEIKQAEPSMAEPFCNLLREYGVEEQVLIASFDVAALEEFRAICPEVATAAHEDEVRLFFVLNQVYLSRLFSPVGLALEVPEYSGSLHILTERFVRAVQARNVAVYPWTINEVDEMRKMLDLGVDGIITDRPDLLLELLDR